MANSASGAISELIRQGVEDGQLSDQQIIDDIVTRYNGEELLGADQRCRGVGVGIAGCGLSVAGVAGLIIAFRRGRVGAQALAIRPRRTTRSSPPRSNTTGSSNTTRSTMNPDQLAEGFEEERKFLCGRSSISRTCQRRRRRRRLSRSPRRATRSGRQRRCERSTRAATPCPRIAADATVADQAGLSQRCW